MNRRKALKSIGLSLGTISATPALISLLNRCQSELDWKPKLLSVDQMEVISKYLDLILPKTEDIPSATELGLHKWIDAYAYESLDKDGTEGYLIHLNSLILNSLEVSSKKEVNELSNDDYDKQLKKFLLADKSKIKQWEKMRTEYWMNSPKNSSLPIPEEAMAYYSMITIRNWGVRGYRWGNEYIAKNVLDYRPVPGQQKGCVDLNKTTGGFVWALQ
tara:strand:+ start:1076 stop:1726 length:651 start_codon:yes stop_codon:yes gene_type:complete